MSYLPLLGAAAVLVAGSAVCAQTGAIRLVKDINTTGKRVSSSPEPGIRQVAGTTNDPMRNRLGRFVRFGKQLAFTAKTANEGHELWISDGSALGTRLVKDIRPGPLESGIQDMIEVGGTLYFGADDGTNGPQLWKSDGTTAGTVPVTAHAKLPWATPSHFYRLSAEDFLFGFQDQTSTSEMGLWVYDGSKGQASAVVDGKSLKAAGFQFAPAGPGKAFVYRHATGLDTLMVTDGTLLGTTTLRSFLNVQYAAMLSLDATRVVLGVDDGNGAGRELWISDGTGPGTKLVADLYAGSSAGADLSIAISHKNKVYFGARTGQSYLDDGLWVTDGTAAGTIRLRANALPMDFEILNGKVYCSINAVVNGYHVCVTDGTVANTQVVDSGFGGQHMIVTNGKLLFRDARSGALHATDGSPNNVVGLPPYYWNPSPNVQFLATLGDGRVLFSAEDGTHGQELWITDATQQGTQLVKDLETGPTAGSAPNGFCDVHGTVFFTANDGTGQGLYRSDGTAAGTHLVANLAATHLARLGNSVVFAADGGGGEGQELWVSDGTTAGTKLVKDIQSGAGSSSPAWLTTIGDRVYFAADDGSAGSELFVTDGTAAGTRMVADIRPGFASSNPRELAPIGYSGELVFQASDATENQELFRSDGTAQGTVLLKAHTGSLSIRPTELTTIAGGRVVFAGLDASSRSCLWVSDGTAAGTVVLDSTLSPQFLTAWDAPARAAFVAYKSTNGAEIYETDGTVQGTKLLVETKPGTATLNPKHLTLAGNGLLYFQGTGTTAEGGVELWATDGSSVQRVEDLHPSGNSKPRGRTIGRQQFLDSRGKLYFAADDGYSGEELRVLDADPWWRAMGTPCFYAASKPTVFSTSAPKLGGSWTWSAQNTPNGMAGVAVLAAPPAVPGPSCGFHFDLAVFFVMGAFVGNGGAWSAPIPVPSTPSLRGVELASQVVYLNAAGLTLTNGVLAVLGP